MANINSKDVFSFFENFSKNQILLHCTGIEILKKGDVFMAHNVDIEPFNAVIGYGIFIEELTEIVRQLEEYWSFNVEKEGVYEVKLLVYFDEDVFEIKDSEAKYLHEIEAYKNEFLNFEDNPFI